MSKAHQSSLDIFLKSKKTTKRHNSDTDSDSPPENDANLQEGSSFKKAKKHRPFNRKYDPEYLKYGFVASGDENSPKPLCVICGVTLSNDAMKPSKLLRHLNSTHSTYKDKPIDFFKRKRDEIKDQQKQMLKATKVNVSALRASFLASFLIARSKKPFTVGEDLIIPCAKEICREMIGESASNLVSMVPLSNDTVANRINEMADDIEQQLVNKIRSSSCFAIQLDESTDVTNLAILLVYVRFEDNGDLVEDMLCCLELPMQTTSAEIFRVLNDYITKNEIDWNKCVGICTDGAAAMTGMHSGLVPRVKAVAPKCTSIHCFIHREMLATKKMSEELHEVLNGVVKVVNFIRAGALNTRLFSVLCEEMGSDHNVLLLHTEVRWLSRGKVLTRVFELRKELEAFIQPRKPGLLEIFNSDKICLVAYLSDIFSLLNELNLSMQGKNSNLFRLMDKICAFQQKISRWINNMGMKRYDMFPLFSDAIESENISEIQLNKQISAVTQHLKSLLNKFKDYFPVENDPRVGNEWVRNPFVIQQNNQLTTVLDDKLIELANDKGLNAIFEKSGSLAAFWINVRQEYPELCNLAMICLTPFASTYRCESGFSAMTTIKTKNRNRLNVCSSLRIALTDIKPRIDLLVKNKQAHVSH